MLSLDLPLTIIAILTTCYSIYITIKHAKLKGRLTRYYWKDIENGISDLSRKIAKKINPDVILSVSGSSSVVSNLYINKNSKFTPIFIAFSLKKGEGVYPKAPDNYTRLETQNWYVYIHKEIANYANKTLLIIDDIIITGATLNKLREHLISVGFREENIYSSALFCTELAIDRGVSPDFYSFKTEDHKFYLPWGRCYGSGNTIKN